MQVCLVCTGTAPLSYVDRGLLGSLPPGLSRACLEKVLSLVASLCLRRFIRTSRMDLLELLCEARAAGAGSERRARGAAGVSMSEIGCPKASLAAVPSCATTSVLPGPPQIHSGVTPGDNV